jgi:hypothetical protein
MIIVFGNEESEVDHAHRFVESGVMGSDAGSVEAELLKPRDQSHALSPKRFEEMVEGIGVMILVAGDPIGDVSRAEFFKAGFIVIEPPVPELLDITKVADLFLDRPFVVEFTRQNFMRQPGQLFFEPSRCAAQPFEDVGKHLDREDEFEFAVSPEHDDSSLEATVRVTSKRHWEA